MMLYLYSYLMGNTTDSNHASTEMSNMTANSDDDIYDEYVEYEYCCGIEVKRIVKRTLIWEENLKRNCNYLEKGVSWPVEIVELVKTKKLSRIEFLREIINLRNQKRPKSVEEEEILLTPSQIDSFKENVKKSVLLSCNHAAKSARMRDNSKIESSISFTPKKQKKNDIYIDHFRKSSVVKESHLQKSGKNSFRQSLMSFVDDTISSLLRTQVKDISKYTSQCLQVFMHFSVIMENHLNNPQNILCLIKNCFIDSIIVSFTQKKVTEKLMESLINTIKQFLVIWKEAIHDYYNIHIFASQEVNNNLIANDENLLNVLTSILFKNEKFYSFLFDTVKEFNHEKQMNFRKILKQIDSKAPEEFQVKYEYCLNQQTMENCMEEMKSTRAKSQDLQTQKVQEEQATDPPYYKCLLALKEIIKAKTPIGKMKIIMDTSEKMTESIRDFYSQNQIILKNVMLDADQILSLFCYIIAAAKIPHLHSHLFILEHFATDLQLISVTGYYYSVLTCAMQQLENTSLQES